MVTIITRIYAERSGVQILDGARDSPKHPGQDREYDHSHPYRAKFKNQWSYTSTQLVCLHGTYWDNFIVPRPPTYVHLTELISRFACPYLRDSSVLSSKAVISSITVYPKMFFVLYHQIIKVYRCLCVRRCR